MADRFEPDEALAEAQIDQRVKALSNRLRAEGQREDAQLVDELHSSRGHTQYWYSTRLERLWHWAHEELNAEQRHQYFSIVANGTSDVKEPPTYAQQFNVMKWRMEEAERKLDMLRRGESEITGQL